VLINGYINATANNNIKRLEETAKTAWRFFFYRALSNNSLFPALFIFSQYFLFTGVFFRLAFSNDSNSSLTFFRHAQFLGRSTLPLSADTAEH